MKNNIYIMVLGVFVSASMWSCMDDLNTEPLDDQILNGITIYDSPESYKQFLAKLYGSMSITGQQGEAGKAEISAPDEGTTSFMRTYWSAQELTTDEAIGAWNDPGVQGFHRQNWTAVDNGLLTLLYQRVFINIAYCNEYIREVGSRVDGLSGDLHDDVVVYLAEAKMMRALYYYFAMDLWGNVPFVTPEDGTGAFLPTQISRADLFEHIESEILAALPTLKDAGQNEYARIDKAMAWMLLAKMYLNAEVYIKEDRYSDCLTYCNLILNSGQYELINNYSHLFLADNHRHRKEIIFTVAEDGNHTRNYGGVTFIIHAAVGGTMDAANVYGISAGGWSGNRPTTSWVEQSFADVTGATDKRAIFHTDGQTLEITDPILFNQGYLSGKFKNVTSAGVIGVHPMFVDTDFPMFRLADVYLMYAESVKRGGAGGTDAKAVELVNMIRTRAYGNTSGNIASTDLTLDFILAERGRELYWEAHRRTDLIRFKKFTEGNKVWDWKGGEIQGIPTSNHRNVFPIPALDLGLNTNLKQNENYN